VGNELVNQFEEQYVKRINGKFFLDLISANYGMLIEQGVPEKNIEVSQLCSFQEVDLLHSYRREGKTSGRAFGIIGMKY
jgi:copper oxidase (laccase) domain-containing protein